MRSTTLGILLAFVLLLATVMTPVEAAAQEGDFLWRVLTVRAAPGRLLEVIELYREQQEVEGQAGEGEVYWMRHSQGDQWDLLLMYPMGSFAEYYSSRRRTARAGGRSARGRSGSAIQHEIDGATSLREELFARGPTPEVVGARYEGTGLFHIEMFIALHDKREELLEQRRMENTFYRELNRGENLIFVREAGAEWDMFTLGFYTDLKGYAAAGDLPAEVEERAALAAGFEAANRIGTYLRSLMLRHSDTLAGRVR